MYPKSAAIDNTVAIAQAENNFSVCDYKGRIDQNVEHRKQCVRDFIEAIAKLYGIVAEGLNGREIRIRHTEESVTKMIEDVYNITDKTLAARETEKELTRALAAAQLAQENFAKAKAELAKEQAAQLWR